MSISPRHESVCSRRQMCRPGSCLIGGVGRLLFSDTHTSYSEGQELAKRSHVSCALKVPTIHPRFPLGLSYPLVCVGHHSAVALVTDSGNTHINPSVLEMEAGLVYGPKSRAVLTSVLSRMFLLQLYVSQLHDGEGSGWCVCVCV